MTEATTESISDRPQLSKRAEQIVKVIMVLSGPLLLILLLEGGAFLWERAQAQGPYAWEMVASRRIDLDEYPEPGAGYTLMEPGSRYEWQGIPVTINSRGLRNPEVAYEKPAGTVRVLNLGDSIAMGWGVREEETYGRQLEQMLNESAAGGQSFQVINAGVPGWNPENELAFLQAEGLKYDPDLILLDLTIVNDIFGDSALKTNRRPALIEWLRANTYSWPFLSIQLSSLEARSDGRERIPVIDPPKTAESYFPLDPADERWDKIWKSVAAMKQLADESGADFVLVLFPLEHQVLDVDYSTLPQTVLTQRAEEAGIDVVDLLPAFRRACEEKPEAPCRLEDRYLFADVWMHPSALGNSVTAAEILATLGNLNN